MRLFTLIWDALDARFDLDTRWAELRGWLSREDCKTQRRIALATSLIFLSLVILLASTCDGGPQIQP